MQNFSVCLGDMSAKKTAEDSAEIFAYVGNNFGIPRHFPKSLVFFNSCDQLFCRNDIDHLYTLNGYNGR